MFYIFFFFNDTATTEIYTLSLHDALPISVERDVQRPDGHVDALEGVEVLGDPARQRDAAREHPDERSEEHTSELQSRQYLVCRLLLEKKKYAFIRRIIYTKPYVLGTTHVT